MTVPEEKAVETGEQVTAKEDWYKDLPTETIALINTNLGGMQGALTALKTEKDGLKIKAAEREKAEAEAEAARQAAAAAKLEENKEFETLATQQKTELETLKPKVATLESTTAAQTEQIEKLSGIVSGYLKAERDALELTPGYIDLLDKMDDPAQLEWIAKHKAELTAKSPSGIPPSRESTNTGGMSDEEKRTLTRKPSM
jgi:hypothetical protein